MAKLTREELEHITGEKVESILRDKRIRLATSPFGAKPGKVIAYVSRAVSWKKRGRAPRKLHLTQD